MATRDVIVGEGEARIDVNKGLADIEVARISVDDIGTKLLAVMMAACFAKMLVEQYGLYEGEVDVKVQLYSKPEHILEGPRFIDRIKVVVRGPVELNDKEAWEAFMKCPLTPILVGEQFPEEFDVEIVESKST